MRLGLLSDAHGNFNGFERGLNLLREREVDDIWYLGDAIGYLVNTQIVSFLRNEGIHALKGNHEDMMFKADYPEEKEGFYRLQEIKKNMTVCDLNFLNGLPDHVRHTVNGKQCLFVHGSPADYMRDYVYPDTSLAPFYNDIADVIFMGNTHYPFIRKEAGKLFVNVGSCGFPRDNITSGSVCIYDVKTSNAQIIRYDIKDIMLQLVNDDEVSLKLKKYLEEKITGK